MKKPRIVIFASGTKTGEGSGLRQLVKDISAKRTREKQTDRPILNADIIAVVSQHLNGGVQQICHEMGINFSYMVEPYDESAYQYVVNIYQPDFIVLAGWTMLVKGIDFKSIPTINIHPALLPKFGGKGMVGLNLHQQVINSGAKQSGITIHFVDKVYDQGKIIFQHSVPIMACETAKDLQKRLKVYEHWYYGQVINQVLLGADRVDFFDVKPLRDSLLLSL